MKKFIAILLAITLVFSLVVLAGCASDSGDAAFTASTSAENERSDNDGRVVISDDEFVFSRPSSSTNTSSSSNGGAQASSGGDSSSTSPVVDSPKTGEVLAVDVECPARIDYNPATVTAEEYAMDSIAAIGTVTFSDSTLFAIQDAEEAYDQVSNKALVTSAYSNYLTAARLAFDKKSAETAVSKIADILAMDLKIETLSTFDQRAQVIESYRSSMKSENYGLITNYADFQNKVTAASNVTVTVFQEAVAKIATFAYTEEYKSLLDAADNVYDMIDSTKKASVATEKAALETKKLLYSDTKAVKDFAARLAALPADPNTITEGNKAEIKALKTLNNLLTESQKALSEYSAANNRLQQYLTAYQSKWTEYVYIVANGDKKGDTFFTNNNASSASRSECPGYYEGVLYEAAIKAESGRSTTFTTTGAGVLTVIANRRDKDADVGAALVLKLGGTQIDSQSINHSSDGTNTEYTFNCPSAGSYELSNSAGQAVIFVLAFS